MKKIYSRILAAAALDISLATLDRYRRKGLLPFHKIGDRVVFTESDIDAFLDICAIPAKGIPVGRAKLAMRKVTVGEI